MKEQKKYIQFKKLIKNEKKEDLQGFSDKDVTAIVKLDFSRTNKKEIKQTKERSEQEASFKEKTNLKDA